MKNRISKWNLLLIPFLLILGPSAASAASSERMEQFVGSLSDPAMEGRVPGSDGIEAAARLIAERFAEIGLKPGGKDGGWFQEFVPDKPLIEGAVTLPDGKHWGSITLKNVIGLLPGSKDECVIIGAHYDHIGRNVDGELVPGADDNASGVAVLCDVAGELAGEAPLNRTLVFIAFSGEEEGLLGSRWYAEHPVTPLQQAIGMINLDTIGRMTDRRLFILSTESAAEFSEMFSGINLGFGFDLSISKESAFSSDHTPMIEKGVPAVHLFTGPNADYHRPGDRPEKLNYEEMVEIAGFTAEAIRYLSDRTRPLTFVPPGADKVKPPETASSRSPRRVSLGSIPDFNDQGEGVLLSGVLPGSPAEKAGMQKGDRIVAIDDEPIKNLEDFSIILKTFEPGNTIRVAFLRDGERKEIEATLVERK